MRSEAGKNAAARGPRVTWEVCQRFRDPGTGVLYDRPYEMAAARFPTPQQAADGIPNPCGWLTDCEDCALNLGFILPYMIERADREGDGYWTRAALDAADVILRLISAADTRGFLPRCVLPDGKSHYPNSSVDQYTMVLNALLHLGQWREAGEERRRRAQAFAADAVELMSKHAWDIPTETGGRAFVCDASALTPDRATRLLQFLLIANTLTGRGEYMDTYRRLRDERGGRRARGTALRSQAPPPFALLQTQVSLDALARFDPDPPWRLVWALHMRDNAEMAMDQLERSGAAIGLADSLAVLGSYAREAVWQELTTEEDIRRRHEAGHVSQWVQRVHKACPRREMERRLVRNPLELLCVHGLAGDAELVDATGQPLAARAEAYRAAFLETVEPRDLIWSTGPVALLALQLKALAETRGLAAIEGATA